MKTKSVAALFSLAAAFLFTASASAQTVESLTIGSRLFEPYGVAVDYTDGNVYISDGSHNQLLRFNPTKGVTTVVKEMNASPEGIAVMDHPIYGHGIVVAVPVSFSVQFIKLPSFETVVIAGGVDGSGQPESALVDGDGGPGGPARFRSPAGIATTKDGYIYVADLIANRIRLIAPTATPQVTTLGFTGLNRPAAIAVTPGNSTNSNTIYIADNRNYLVKEYIVNGSIVPTRALSIQNSNGEQAGPRGLLWLGGDTGLLIATDQHAIYRGFGSSGFGNYAGIYASPGFAEGPAATAQFNQPVGLALDVDGQILVADLKNDAIRRIRRPQAPPPEIAHPSGAYTNTLSVEINNASPLNFPNSRFFYTTDGKDPSPLSPEVASGGTVPISSGPTPLKVRAYDPDYGASIILSNRYEFAVSPLTFKLKRDPSAAPSDVGTFVGFQSNNIIALSINSATVLSSLKYYYTVDGTVPTTNSLVWDNSGRDLASNTLFNVIATRDGFKPSEVLSNDFHFFVDKPVMRYATNVSDKPIQMMVETATEGAKLYYTVNSALPPSSANPDSTEIVNRVPFTLTRTGSFKVVGEKVGYESSNVTGDFVGENFTLKVGKPEIRATKTASSSPIPVTFESSTGTNVSFYYTTDGTLPSKSSTLYAGPFTLTQSGAMRVIGYRDTLGDAFEPSDVTEQIFTLTVAKPLIISAIPANSPTNVIVRVKSETPGAKIRWVINGDPTSTGPEVSVVDSDVPFTIPKTGTLSVVATFPGFISSEVVSVPVVMQVSNPQIRLTPAANATNSVTVAIGSFTLDAGVPQTGIAYTLDGSNPLTNQNRLIYSAPFTVDTNAVLQVVATNLNFLNSDTLSTTINIEADAPVMDPPNGFFQDGTFLTFTVARTSPTFSTPSAIYYTLDGSEPTTNSFKYAGKFQINAVNFPSASLRTIRARAFADGVNPSGIRAGELSSDNKVGIQREITYGGSGATIYMPVVVSLKAGTTLRSFQYRVQIYPADLTSPVLASNALQAVSVRSNSFVKLIGNDGNTTNFVSTPTRIGTTNELALSFLANTSNLELQEFGSINLLSVKLPANAAPGNSYKIRVIEASGTKDGAQDRIVFNTAVPEGFRTIAISNFVYTVGDSSPGGWYNAGDFGDGDLDNSDVNNAFYASLGSRVPEPNSDVFNAMDVFPIDVDGFDFGGDQQIRFLDWNIILRRSLRLDPVNFTRHWTNSPDFVNPVSQTLDQLTRNTSALSEADVVSVKAAAAAPAASWFRPAHIEAQVRRSVEPGAIVNVPVVIEVKQNFDVEGVQFAATIESNKEGAALPALAFTRSAQIGGGIPASELPAGQVGYAWPLGSVHLGGGIHTLGTISFVVPADAAPGTIYNIRFTNADGAENIHTQYDIETLRGTVIVRGTLPPNPFGRVSDEWLRRFFGSVENALAFADGDADGDGISNWDEFLAGTNPTELRFQRQADWVSHAKKGFRLKFFAAPGATYIIESAPALTGPWTQIGTGVIGDGSLKEFLDENQLDLTKFYRVRTQP
jgi:hypothetical protein